MTPLFPLSFRFWKNPLKDLRFCLPFRQPAEPKRRRLRKLGEIASVVAETSAAGGPQQVVVPPAGEHRAEGRVEEVAPPPVPTAAPPMAQRRTEEAAEEAAPSSARAATPPAVENRTEEVIEEATSPPPTRAADAPSVQQGTEETVDEEIIIDQPPEEEAGSRGVDASEAVADTAVTGGAGGSHEETEAEAPPEDTGHGAGDEGMPSPQRALEAGSEGGALSSPLAAPETTVSPRQEASGATTGIEASAPSSSAGALVRQEPRRRATLRRAVIDHALQALGEVEGQLVREELALAAERARLGEAWSLLHERVELCRRQDAAAQAERQEALRFAKETRDSVKREAQEVMD